MEPTPFSAAPVVRNAALRSPHALQNSAVWIIRCGVLGNGLLSSLWNILDHLRCSLRKLFAPDSTSELGSVPSGCLTDPV